ncbi:MAG: endonuclease/exonuclease/phosphatase family protein [Janthinobacterium lividum]
MSGSVPRVASDRPAWDSTPDRRRRPSAAVVVALLLLAPSVAATLLRVFPPSDDLGAMLASFVPYGLVTYALALVLLLVALARAHRRGALGILTLVVAVVTGLHVSWLVPFFVPDHRPVVGPSFTVYAQNVYLGQADTARLAEVASGADVVVLSETTRAFLHRLQTPAWDERFPYGVGDLSGSPSDTTVFSRFPLEDAQVLAGSLSTQWVMTLEVPDRTPVRLVGTHPCNPYCGGGAFARDHAVLEQTVLANESQPLVVAGDLNAIDDHAPLLRLRADGMRSVTDLVGAGWVPTYPANRWFPPLLPIDHVLVDDQLTATSLRTVRMPGSDHLGLLATVAGTH